MNYSFIFSYFLRSSAINRHESFFFLLNFFFRHREMFEIMSLFIFCKPSRKRILIFKRISWISWINNIFSSSLSLHFFRKCKGFCQIIDIEIFLFRYNFESVFLNTDRTFFFFKFFLFCSFHRSSSFLHIRTRYLNHILVVIGDFTGDCFIGIDFTVRSLSDVKIFVVHINILWIFSMEMIIFIFIVVFTTKLHVFIVYFIGLVDKMALL